MKKQGRNGEREEGRGVGEEIRERNYKVSESGSSVASQIGKFKKHLYLG